LKSNSDFMKNFKTKEKGALIVEVLIVIVIITIALVSLLGLATFSLKTSGSIKESNVAVSLARETMEAVRNFRDGTDWGSNGLGTLAPESIYHPQKSADNPPKWTMVSGTETIDGFSRKVVLSSVMRDAGYNIVQSGGSNDPYTRKVTVTVSFSGRSVEIISYLTNWKQ